MNEITITGINRFASYFEINYIGAILLPQQFVGLTNANIIAQSYNSAYGVTGSYFTYQGSVSLSNDTQQSDIEAALIVDLNKSTIELNAFTLLPCDQLLGTGYNGTTWE